MTADPKLPPSPLRIGSVTVDPPIVLAPMSSLTNLPMRTVSEEAGCGLTVTEFIAAPALAAAVPKEVHKLQPSLEGRSFSVQIFGRDPGQMATAARMAVDVGAELVDINMGCPSRKVTKGSAGSALMRVPELAEELVRAVKEAVKGKAEVTIKTRAGWDAEHRTAPQFAARMVEAGAVAVTIHGRTAKQGFSGQADLEIIAAVKEAVDVPVIGNGDVKDTEGLERMFTQTGCDGVMIGRAALGNPWIFARCAAWCRGEAIPPLPSHVDRLRMYMHHLDLYLTIASPWTAVREMRKFAGWYVKGFPGASNLRKTIYQLEQIEQIRQLVGEVRASLEA